MRPTPYRKSAAALPLALLPLAALIMACGGAQDTDISDPVGDTSPSDGTAPIGPAEPTKPTKPTSGDPTSSGDPIQPTSPAVTVAFAASLPDGDFSPLTEVDIESTPALYVVADWTGVMADQVERLELTAPKGTIYCAPQLTLAPGATATKTVTTLPGGVVRAVYKLTIWSTPIDTLHQAGTWTATAILVDGDITGAASLTMR